MYATVLNYVCSQGAKKLILIFKCNRFCRLAHIMELVKSHPSCSTSITFKLLGLPAEILVHILRHMGGTVAMRLGLANRALRLWLESNDNFWNFALQSRNWDAKSFQKILRPKDRFALVAEAHSNFVDDEIERRRLIYSEKVGPIEPSMQNGAICALVHTRAGSTFVDLSQWPQAKCLKIDPSKSSDITHELVGGHTFNTQSDPEIATPIYGLRSLLNGSSDLPLERSITPPYPTTTHWTRLPSSDGNFQRIAFFSKSNYRLIACVHDLATDTWSDLAQTSAAANWQPAPGSCFNGDHLAINGKRNLTIIRFAKLTLATKVLFNGPPPVPKFVGPVLPALSSQHLLVLYFSERRAYIRGALDEVVIVNGVRTPPRQVIPPPPPPVPKLIRIPFDSLDKSNLSEEIRSAGVLCLPIIMDTTTHASITTYGSLAAIHHGGAVLIVDIQGKQLKLMQELWHASGNINMIRFVDSTLFVAFTSREVITYDLLARRAMPLKRSSVTTTTTDPQAQTHRNSSLLPGWSDGQSSQSNHKRDSRNTTDAKRRTLMQMR